MENEIKNREPQSKDSDSAAEIKFSLKRLVVSIWKPLRETLSFKEGTDIESTTTGIIRDIEFKGHNVFILVCSIFIASIGLNINSTAVVIGAMLISPLMGPILGVGLSVATNDFEVFKKSLKSLGVATGAALATSFIYFLITPLKADQPELLSRTAPTLLDALVAIFGGFAGIIAGSRKEKTNVVPGVAIATALMPPLCTAGYGLAIGNFAYFFGALYLFLLNSLFISISTFIVVKYLEFPQKTFVDPVREKTVKRYIYTIIALVIIPSAFIFYNVIKKTIFFRQADQFITENVSFEGSEVINQKITYTDTISKIELFLMGEHIPASVEKNLNGRLPGYGLEKTILKIHQAKDNTADIAGQLSKDVKSGIIEDLYLKNQELIAEKNKEIEFLTKKIEMSRRDSIPFISISKEIKVLDKDLESFAYAQSISVNELEKIDTIPVLLVHWSEALKNDQVIEKQGRLKNWVQLRLKQDSVRVVRY